VEEKMTDEKKAENEISKIREAIEKTSESVTDLAVTIFAKDELSLGEKRKAIRGGTEMMMMMTLLRMMVGVAGVGVVAIPVRKDGTIDLPEKCRACEKKNECLGDLEKVREILTKGGATCEEPKTEN